MDGAKYDPGAVLVTDLLLEWARAAWDGSSCDEEMTVAWRAAVQLSGAADRPFQTIKGLAGAMIASASKIGWRVPSAFAFINRQ